jgi:hypothetical protein
VFVDRLGSLALAVLISTRHRLSILSPRRKSTPIPHASIITNPTAEITPAKNKLIAKVGTNTTPQRALKPTLVESVLYSINFAIHMVLAR